MAIVAVCTIGSAYPAPIRGWLLEPSGGIAWPLRRTTLIGRSPLRHLGPAPEADADLVIVDDPDVSRAHLELAVLVDGSVHARPIAPAALTTAEGSERPLEVPTALTPDAVVRLGSLELRFIGGIGSETWRTGEETTGPMVPVEVADRPQTAHLDPT